MIFTIGTCERLNAVPASTVAGPGAPATLFTGNNEAKTVLADRTGDGRIYAYRFIQNTGNTTVNYAINQNASAGEYHGQIASGAQLAVPVMGPVSVFGAGAWAVPTLELIRTQG